LLIWCGVAIMFVTNILSSSEENAAKSAPFVVLILPSLMVLVLYSIYNSAPPDSGTHKPPIWYVICMLTLWATCLCAECWTYFRRRSPKDDDHVV
jgi:drug/metabolite transporter (DMT)-like permease